MGAAHIRRTLCHCIQPLGFRWLLAISTSANGNDYTNLLVAYGEITRCAMGATTNHMGLNMYGVLKKATAGRTDGNPWLPTA